ncbi:hypothetical protein [Yoonia sediminilitoris]|uniref:Uncharacterized protein n=1 Tax=Yoonia sediminilitoris TaxID=1286148 RepID=A0A2T6KFS9_9RHOB|nr:hypothetical protein [Yoonia sediminilitoris]PUB14140.1 hypothetical protein C8N45_10613 [Yoonia sediminilitoris]RCW95071.1 hypothetical protein DFP92_10613 [Yoonia sediminilitoris]
MEQLLSDSLFLPALVLAALGFAVPRILARFLPEGVKPLFLNAFLSSILLFAASAAFFFCLYLWQGAPMAEIMAAGALANIVFFGRLGLIAAMIWAPIMILSVAGLPRKWVKETW